MSLYDEQKFPPRSVWISLRELAPGTTKEEIQAWLADRGISAPPSCIRVTTYRDKGHNSAIVALTHAEVLKLFQRAMLDLPLRGKLPFACQYGNNE